LYTNKEEDWNNLVRKAMSLDFGWEKSARAYSDLYRELENK